MKFSVIYGIILSGSLDCTAVASNPFMVRTIDHSAL